MSQKDAPRSLLGPATDRIGSRLSLAAEAPTVDAFTEYDERHFAVYLSLLYGNAEGLSEDDMALTILEIDPNCEPEQARQSLRSHLARAQWLATTGRHHILDEPIEGVSS